MDSSTLRWWGWGALDRRYPLQDRPELLPVLRRWLDLSSDLTERPPVTLEEIDLRPPRLDDPVLVSLRRLIGEERVHIDRPSRVLHACGRGYRDLVRLRAGLIPNPPDAVVYPADEGQVAALLSWAADRDVAIIPFGGGTSTRGSLEPTPGEQLAITLDMTHLDQLVSFDLGSWSATMQAGMRGPALEAALNARGFTLGHFPQSFEFSTLGGWLATRASGHSAGYGGIDDAVLSARVVSPAGILEARNAPSTADRPHLLDVLLGCEGAFGVITEATMHVRPTPQIQDCRGFMFHDFDAGMSALSDLVRSGLPPTLARLSDEGETAFLTRLTDRTTGLRGLWEQGVRLYRGIERLNNGDSSFLLLGYEGEAEAVKERWREATALCRDRGGLPLGRVAAGTWKEEWFAEPYLRDTLVGSGVLIDEFETSTSWSNLPQLYEELRTAAQVAVRTNGGGPGYVTLHLCHPCTWGASLHVGLMGRQTPGQELEQWWAIRQAVMETLLDVGGTMNHHSGAGPTGATWLERSVGPLGMRVLRAAKDAFDPPRIMNPAALAGAL